MEFSPSGTEFNLCLNSMVNNLNIWAHDKVRDLARKIKTTRKELNNQLNIEDKTYNPLKLGISKPL